MARERTPRRRGGGGAEGTSCAPGKLPGCLVRLTGGGLGRPGDAAGARVRVRAGAGWARGAPRFHTQRLPRLGCWRVDVCTRCVGSGAAAGRELPEAEGGYWISRSSAGEGRGALSPGRESSGSHAFSPGRRTRLLPGAGGLARPSGCALPAPLLQAPGSGWEARTWARTCKLVWVSCVTLGTLSRFHIFFFRSVFPGEETRANKNESVTLEMREKAV